MRATISEKARRRHEERRLAVALVEGAPKKGAAQRAAAKALKTSVRSVRRWRGKARGGALHPKALGRPPAVVDRPTRQGMISLLVALGPLASVAAVRALFQTVPYRQIAAFKRRLARVLARRRGRHERKLKWYEPGRVWAMDFTQPKAELDGKNRKLFVVRDLASGARLACVPCRGELASVTIRTLRVLFAAHGAPLVLKHDNGGAFTAHKTQRLLEENDVQSLPSPVYTPQYNGSCERSLGWTKQRIAHIAEREGHAGNWTAENIEQARLQANATLRPWGPRGPTPGEAFKKRRAITKAERRAFNGTIEKRIHEELLKDMTPDGRLIVKTPIEVITRRAITYALRKHGYLEIWRGRESTPLSVC